MKHAVLFLSFLILFVAGSSVANAATLYSVSQSDTVVLGNIPINSVDYYNDSVENQGTLWDTWLANPGSDSVRFYGDVDCTGSDCTNGYHYLPIGTMLDDEYMAITGTEDGDFVRYSFSEGQSSVSFNWGSVEADNKVRLTMTNASGDTQYVTITGQEILDANLGLTAGLDNTYVTITALTDYLITAIAFVIGSELSVFEISDLSGTPASVPLPGALVLFGSALVGVGAASRRKKEKRA